MSDLSPDYFTKPIADVDPEIADVLRNEAARQESTLEMIASENFVPQAVLDCQGSVLTNKYAEGYPGKRYYGGCEHVDVAEQLAIDRAKELFGAEHANVQPHSGAQANSAVYMALLEPGDRILGMKLDHGGHLTHGMKINFSGLYFDIVAYGVREEDSRLDMDELQQLAEDSRPKLILAGWSAYPRQLDFQRFREIADSVGAVLVADMAHFAGLVAAEQHPSPIPYCDVVTTTTHKTLGGARGGMILCKEEYAKKINSRVFPGQQGGPLMHVIAGKAVALKMAQTELFRERQQRTREGAAVVAEEMLAAGVNVLTGGTDVHLVLADLRDSELDGQQAEDRLARDRHHRQPQRGAVRPAAAGGVVRPADRHAGARHARPAGRRLPRDRPGHRRDAHRRLRRRQAGGAVRAHAGARRALPALPPARARRRSERALRARGRVAGPRRPAGTARTSSLTIEPGATAVLGPSGSGKSTLLRLLNRLADPDAGSVRFHGEDVRGLDPLELRRRAVLVPQLPAPLPGSVADNVRYGPTLRGDEVDPLGPLEQAGLDASYAERDAARLSVGEQQRVMLARALALEPEVLLLDEPTAALDERAKRGVEETLSRLPVLHRPRDPRARPG